MVKIIIINDNKQLDLKGNEKTIEDIKDTLSTYYGYIRTNILFFIDKECTRQFKENIKFSSYIEQLTLYMKYNKEEDDDNSSLKSKNDENNESDSDSYPKDLRKVVEQINQKEEKKNKYLNHKRNFEVEENKPEKYNVSTGKLASDFLTDKEELYDILNSKDSIYISKIISEDEMKEKKKNNNNIFNYKEFEKKNDVKEPILNLEDLLNYLDKNTQKGQKKEKFMEENKQNEDEQIYSQNNNINNNYEDDYFYDINKIDDQNINYEEITKNEQLNKKIECGKILKNSFVKCNKKILNINERKQLKDIINTLDLENNNYGNSKNLKQEKINLILDLDNTIIFSFLDNQKLNREKVNNKINDFKKDNNRNEKIYTIDTTINMGGGKTFDFFTFFKFRNGTEEFFKKLKPFCNFYVNSNAAKEYVHTIVQQIEKTYDIKIIKFLYRNESNKKNFNDLEIDYSKSIIIDDRIDVWQHYYLPKHCLFPTIFLLPSKKYYDNRLLEKSFLINKNQFKGFHIIVNKENDWRIPVSYILDDNYFLNKDSIPLNLENENDKKFQLIYLSKVIKKIVSLRNFWVYYIEKESNLKSTVLINLIRHTIFSNKIFDTSYLYENSFQNNQKNIIKSIIECLGGEVYDSDDIYSNNNVTHYLIGLNLNESDKKKLKNIKKYNKSLFFVNAKYVFDCYYFLTELNENDEEYKINI